MYGIRYPGAALLLAGAFLAHGDKVAAQDGASIACGEDYTVAQGDSLSLIAARVAPVPIGFSQIVAANPGKLTNPNSIDIGLVLAIPCEAGVAAAAVANEQQAGEVAAEEAEADETPAAAAPAPTPEPEPAEAAVNDAATAAAPAPAPTAPASVALRRVDILTGSSYAPYVDRDLPEGGFSTHLVNRIFSAPEINAPYRIDTIDDWSSHLRILLAERKYDLAYPWFQPDCTQYERLGDEGKWRCDNLRFSKPLHEVVVSYFARSDEAAALSTTEALAGKRICRPQGYFTHDLAAAGLLPPYTERLAPRTPEDCFQMLLDGEADVVTVNADTSEAVIASLDAGAKMQEIDALATIETLHLVGMKSNAKTRPVLLRFNRGLDGLVETGEWFDIAAIHLK